MARSVPDRVVIAVPWPVPTGELEIRPGWRGGLPLRLRMCVCACLFLVGGRAPFPRRCGSGSSRNILHAVDLGDPQQPVENVAGSLTQDTPACRATSGRGSRNVAEEPP